MNRYLRAVLAIGAMGAYLAALLYIVPPDKPYFILAIGIVGLVSWLLGSIQGLISIVVLIPLTTLVYKQFSVSTSYLHFSSSPAYLGIQVVAALAIGHMRREKELLRRKDEELEEANAQLQTILSQVQELGGIHNLCSGCKKVQDDKGDWQSIDSYLKKQTKMEFSHCICPECADEFHSTVNQPTDAACCGPDDR